jgi:GNAT superfamily N-acetyltransferase
MLIRDARPDDLDVLLRMLDEDAIREVTEDLSDLRSYAAALDEILAAPHSTVLVGELDGEIVATAQVTWQRRLMYGAGVVCQVESVRVSSSRRGQGLGAELMRWIIDDAERRTCARIELTSNAKRVDARRFYERLGFKASHVGMKMYLRKDLP